MWSEFYWIDWNFSIRCDVWSRVPKQVPLQTTLSDRRGEICCNWIDLMCNALIDSCLSELRQSATAAANEVLHLTPTPSADHFVLLPQKCLELLDVFRKRIQGSIQSFIFIRRNLKIAHKITDTHACTNANKLSTNITNSADHLPTYDNSSCTRSLSPSLTRAGTRSSVALVNRTLRVLALMTSAEIREERLMCCCGWSR